MSVERGGRRSVRSRARGARSLPVLRWLQVGAVAAGGGVCGCTRDGAGRREHGFFGCEFVANRRPVLGC